MKYGGVELSYKNNSKVYHEADIRNDYRKLTKLLIEKNLTITTMESATSGQIASLITDTEGSSAVLKGAFVTYCNEAKIMQGVPAEVLGYLYGIFKGNGRGHGQGMRRSLQCRYRNRGYRNNGKY